MTPSQIKDRRLAIAAELLEVETEVKCLTDRYNKLRFENLRLQVVERIGLAGVAFCRIDLWKRPPDAKQLRSLKVHGDVMYECVILEVHRRNAIVQYAGSGKYRAPFHILHLVESGVTL